MFGLVS